MERIHDSDGGEHVQRKKKVWNKISSVSVRHFILLEPWPSTLYINMHKVSRAASLTEKGNTDFANCDAFFSFSFRGKKQLKSEAIMKHFSRIYILFVTFIYSSAVRGHTKLQHEYLFSFFLVLHESDYANYAFEHSLHFFPKQTQCRIFHRIPAEERNFSNQILT